MLPIDRFYSSLGRNPESIAVAGAHGNMTYAQLGDSVDALAAALQEIDPTPGGRVGICARNTTEHLIGLLGTYAAGKVWIPLNPRNGRAELDAMIAATNPGIVIADGSCLGRFTPKGAPLIIARCEEEKTDLLTVRGLITKWAGKRPRRIERKPEDAQILKFSGGSTGTPRPVVQSIRSINAQADGIGRFFEFRSDDVNLIAAPLTHGASCFVLPILEMGGCHVLLEDAKPPEMFAAMGRFAVTTLYAPPTLLLTMLAYASSVGPEIRSLRHVIYSAAPMSPAKIRECQRLFGPVIETAYGQVEAPQIVTAMRASELAREENLLSVGRPSSVATVRIMDADGSFLPPGEIGEIVVAGPLVMTGYLDRPDATAEAIVDGWLHTGDLGEIDDRGYLFIRGRIRELINSGGFKVFPAEVEVALARHPAVLECAVFGVDDAKWGEAVNAAVVLRPRMPVGAEQLIDFVKAELDSVKAPKRIHFVQGLERNAAGKVSRAAVRESVAAMI